MPEAEHFTAFGDFNGFPFCLSKVDVSGYDHWTTLGGYNKVDAGSGLDPTGIAGSLDKAAKLFWNYNGHTVDFPESFNEATLIIDIEQEDFESGNVTAPFEPKDRSCRTIGWEVDQIEDPEFGDQFIGVEIDPIRMYNGSTDDEDNFVGYGMSRGSSPSGHEVFFAEDSDVFYFSSYLNEEGSDSEAYEYSEAIEDDMWFVAAAEGGGVGNDTPTITGLTAEFFNSGSPVGTITYQDFDFWTYPT